MLLNCCFIEVISANVRIQKVGLLRQGTVGLAHMEITLNMCCLIRVQAATQACSKKCNG